MKPKKKEMDAEQFFNAMRYFGEPRIPENSDYPSLLKTYIVGLSRYSGDVLRAASKSLLETRNYRNFPLLAECIQACRDAQTEFAEQRIAEQGRQAQPKIDAAWLPARIKAADRMMDSDVGRRAAEGRWIIGLHDFCREQNRLPTDAEATQVRLQALSNRRIREELARNHSGKTLPTIVVIAGKAMEAKANRLTAIAIGE